MLAIKVNQLVKQYKNGVKALDGLTFEVNEGEIFSLLGPNGAGKSSLINILTTFYKPTSGSVTMLSKDLFKEASWIRSQTACVAQTISIDAHLSLMENMLFQSRLYKVEPQTAKKRIDNLIDCFGLSSYMKYPTINYSGGVKRRLDIAMNMVSSPKILFLDELTVGMDVDSRKAMWDMLLKIRNEFHTTIFLTTHYLEEADQLSDSICIMKEGKKMVQGSPHTLRRLIRQNLLRITFENMEEANKIKDSLGISTLISASYIRENFIFAEVKNSKTDLIEVTRYLVNQNIFFQGIEIVEPSLEDVFLSLTSTSKEKEEAYTC